MLLALAALAPAAPAETWPPCDALPPSEGRLDGPWVLRFFAVTEALEQAAADLGLEPFVRSGSMSGRPRPIDIAQSLDRHEEGRKILEWHLRRSGYCGLTDFAWTQRLIYQAQNFIDIGEDEAALQRQLRASCARGCASIDLLRGTLGGEPVPDCQERCEVWDADFFAVPPAENVAVLKALQDEVPTAYILSWSSLRSGAGPLLAPSP